MQMQENVYVNQDKSRDENQNTNFSSFAEKRFNAIPQEGDYTEITEIEERYPIRLRKDSASQKTSQTRCNYCFFIFSFVIAAVAIALASLALFQSYNKVSASTEITEMQKMLQKSLDDFAEKMNQCEKNSLVFANNTKNDLKKLNGFIIEMQNNLSMQTNFTRNEFQNIDENFQKMREDVNNLNNDASLLRQQIEIFRRYFDVGWTTLSNGYQYRKTNEERNWNESRLICQSWGGDLIVHGIQVANIISSLHDTLSLGSTQYYIGANDQASEGNFVWVNGDVLLSSGNSKSSLWVSSPSQPNNDGDCCRANFNRGTTELIWDGSCSNRYLAVCERPM